MTDKQHNKAVVLLSGGLDSSLLGALFKQKGIAFETYAVGFAGSLVGLLLSVSADLPAGGVIVWGLGAFAVLFAWLVWPMLRHKDAVAEAGNS